MKPRTTKWTFFIPSQIPIIAKLNVALGSTPCAWSSSFSPSTFLFSCRDVWLINLDSTSWAATSSFCPSSPPLVVGLDGDPRPPPVVEWGRGIRGKLDSSLFIIPGSVLLPMMLLTEKTGMLTDSRNYAFAHRQLHNLPGPGSLENPEIFWMSPLKLKLLIWYGSYRVVLFSFEHIPGWSEDKGVSFSGVLGDIEGSRWRRREEVESCCFCWCWNALLFSGDSDGRGLNRSALSPPPGTKHQSAHQLSFWSV